MQETPIIKKISDLMINISNKIIIIFVILNIILNIYNKKYNIEKYQSFDILFKIDLKYNKKMRIINN